MYLHSTEPGTAEDLETLALAEIDDYVPPADAVITAKEDYTETKIKIILKTIIAPFLQKDGGDIEFRSFDNGTAVVRFLGKCQGCPYAQRTLKERVEKISSAGCRRSERSFYNEKQILKAFWILSFYFAVPLLLKMPSKPPQQQKPRLQPFKLQQQKKTNCRKSNRCIGKSRNRCCFPPCIGDSPNRRRSNRTQPRTANEDLRIRRHNLR